MDLSNKKVIITGGAGFLGMNFAEAIAEMGGLPILVDINKESIDNSISILLKKGFKADGFVINITNKQQVNTVINEILDKYGNIDVLINGAAFAMKNLQEGGKNFFAPFEEYDEDLAIQYKTNICRKYFLTDDLTDDGSIYFLQERKKEDEDVEDDSVGTFYLPIETVNKIKVLIG